MKGCEYCDSCYKCPISWDCKEALKANEQYQYKMAQLRRELDEMGGAY